MKNKNQIYNVFFFLLHKIDTKFYLKSSSLKICEESSSNYHSLTLKNEKIFIVCIKKWKEIILIP